MPRRARLGDAFGCHLTGNERACHPRSKLPPKPVHYVDAALPVGQAQIAEDDVRAASACELEGLVPARRR